MPSRPPVLSLGTQTKILKSVLRWPLQTVERTFTFLGGLLDLFVDKKFSEIGSVEYVREQATYVFFNDLLEEMEGNIFWPMK